MKDRKNQKKNNLEADSISLSDTYEFILIGWKTIISCIFLSFFTLQSTNYLWPERNQSGKMYIFSSSGNFNSGNFKHSGNFSKYFASMIVSPDFFSEEDLSLCGTNFINFAANNSFLIIAEVNENLLSIESKHFNSDLVKECLDGLKSTIKEKTPVLVNFLIDRHKRELKTISQSIDLKNNVTNISLSNEIISEIAYLNYFQEDLKFSTINFNAQKVRHISIFILSLIMGFFVGILILIYKRRNY